MKKTRKILRAAEQVARVEKAWEAYYAAWEKRALRGPWSSAEHTRRSQEFARLLESAQAALEKAKEE